MKKIFRLIGLCAICALSPVTAGASLFESFMVSSGDGNSNPAQIYRIPAVTTRPDGTIVALYDNRNGSYDDMPNDALINGSNNKNITVEARVSNDQGHSWSAPVTLGGSDGHPMGDASICFDHKNNRFYAILNAEKSFGAAEGAKVYYTTSSDGSNWDAPKEITNQFADAVSRYRIGFVTSGNILCTKDGTLYCAFVARRYRSGAHVYSDEYVYIFKSEDGGKNWERTNRNELLQNAANESHLAELPDGRLILSVRTSGQRRFMYSSDGGQTWTDPVSSDVKDCGVNSDILAFSDNGSDYLLHVIATEGDPRQKLYAYWSTDNGQTWQSRLLFHGFAGYTSLTRLNDGTFVCLAEVGGVNGHGGMSIVSFRFDMEWLLNGRNNSFDGTLATRSTNYMRIEPHSAFDIARDGAMTVSARIWFPTWGQPGGIVANRFTPTEDRYKNAAGFALFAGWENSRCLSANVTVDGSHDYEGLTPVPGVLNHQYTKTEGHLAPGEWHHVAWSFDSKTGTSTLYVDGTPVETVTDAKYGSNPKGKPISCKYPIFVGARLKDADTPIEVWSGAIDDVRFYNRILSADEMQLDALSGFPILDKDNGLIAAYDFENIEGTKVTDISGNGHDGLLKGDWPPAPREYTTTVLPTEYGTLTVEYFENGKSVTLNEGDKATRSINADYRVHFEPNAGLDEDGFKLIGIFADGRHIENGGFFKTYGNGNVYVLYSEEPLQFELVNLDDDNNEIDRVPFIYDGDRHEYTLTWPDKINFSGKFYVEEITRENVVAEDGSAPARMPLTLFSADRNDFTIGSPLYYVTPGEAHAVINEKNVFSRTCFHSPKIDGRLANANFKLVYTANERTLTSTFNRIGTGVETLPGDTEAEGPVRWFTIGGQPANPDALMPGIYIRVQGSKRTKVLIR